MGSGYTLGVDFGTSNTVAAVVDPDGRVRHLLFDASPLLASGVLVDAGTVLTGSDAAQGMVSRPAAFEPHPKRRVGEGTAWLGDREVEVADLVAAVLGRVAAEARRLTGGRTVPAVLTHPAAWSRSRRSVLETAADRAGLTVSGLVAEPVAAAAYYAEVLGRRVPPGRGLVVYDLGAGTFDVAVVRVSDDGYDVVAADGLEDVGGLDLDAALVAIARGLTARDQTTGPAWDRLDTPGTVEDRLARQALWRDARAAKEQLSRHPTANLRVPIAGAELHVTRDEYEAAVRPLLERTVALTAATVRAANLGPDGVAAVLLVGGASRTPLAATLLHRELGVAPTTIDVPELVVAEGSLYLRPVPAPDTTAADAWPPLEPDPGPAPARPRRPSRRSMTAAVLAVVLAVAGLVYFWPFGDDPGGTPNGSPTSTSPSSSTSTDGRATGDGTTGFPRIVADGGPMEGHGERVRAMAFAPDGSTLASGDAHGFVRVWDLKTHKSRGPGLAGHTNAVTVAFSPDGDTLATGDGRTIPADTRETSVRLWEPREDYGKGPVLAVPGLAVLSVAFSPDSAMLASGGADGSVRLWRRQPAGAVGAALTGHTSRVLSVAFSPDGRQVASGGEDGTVRVWDVSTGRAVGQPLRMDAEAFAAIVRFSPDGRLLLAGGTDGTLRVWDAATRQPLGDLGDGHNDTVAAMWFSADSRTVTTIAVNSSFMIWDLASRTGAYMATVPGQQEGQLDSVAFNRSGDVVATSRGGAVFLWRLTP
ncbi:Hsp70 family protein [Virgisporangium aurantiacum]|uniref:Hsp70 family protein n=1 Tax=Virgisporangium aurantiacum TaxID=175570 RepID=UPI001950DFBE|nr:Hsp70 family protein [Virgisporangium aurantiacum]